MFLVFFSLIFRFVGSILYRVEQILKGCWNRCCRCCCFLCCWEVRPFSFFLPVLVPHPSCPFDPGICVSFFPRVGLCGYSALDTVRPSDAKETDKRVTLAVTMENGLFSGILSCLTDESGGNSYHCCLYLFRGFAAVLRTAGFAKNSATAVTAIGFLNGMKVKMSSLRKFDCRFPLPFIAHLILFTLLLVGALFLQWHGR